MHGRLPTTFADPGPALGLTHRGRNNQPHWDPRTPAGVGPSARPSGRYAAGMLRFELAECATALRGVEAEQAYLFGPDDVAVQGSCVIDDGVLTCTPTITDAVGLSVLIDLDQLASLVEPVEGELPLGPQGCIVLKTTLLPPGAGEAQAGRMSLAMELTRRRIMDILNKLEDWQLFDAQGTGALDRVEAARQLFTRALVARSSPEGSRLAARALLQAVDAGERLALANAARLWSGRIDGSIYRDAVARYERAQHEKPPEGAPILLPATAGVTLPGRPLLGCTVGPRVFSEGLARLVSASCDFLSVPMRWADLEPTEGSYAFNGTDRWIEWAVRTAKIPVVAGPIIDFRKSAVPEWLYIWENDYETLRDLVAEHIKQVVTRYRRTVRRWTVASGLHVNRSFALGFEQMMDLTKICVLLVRRLHPQANVVIELSEPFGEYYAFNRKSVAPQNYAELLHQGGLHADAYGIRLQLGQPSPGRAMRDMLAISAMLDRYAELEKPLIVTALGTPSEGLPASSEGRDPGRYRGGLTEQSQAAWMNDVMAMALAKPYVHSVCWQDLYDTPDAPEMPAGGLISQAGNAKPALATLTELRRCTREGRSPLQQSSLPAPA